MKTAYAIPDGNPIIISGEEVQPIDPNLLPMGFIQLEKADELENKPATNDLTATLNLYCWVVRQTDAGVDDVSVLRELLRSLAKLFQSDKRLGHTVTLLKLKGVDWSGVGRQWPTEAQSGLQAGYVNIEIQISSNWYVPDTENLELTIA